jgi:hypothetical protein
MWFRHVQAGMNAIIPPNRQLGHYFAGFPNGIEAVRHGGAALELAQFAPELL